MDANEQIGLLEQVSSFFTGLHPEAYYYFFGALFSLGVGYLLIKALFNFLGYLLDKVGEVGVGLIDRASFHLGMTRGRTALFIALLPVSVPLVLIFLIGKPLVKNAFFLLVGTLRILGRVINVGKGGELGGRMDSQEIGAETRRIAVGEFKVPSSFYNHCVVNDIEDIKGAALYMKENDDSFKDFSWPRMLAITVYGEFRQSCQQYQMGNPVQEERLINLGVRPDMIMAELDRDPAQVLHGLA